VKRTVGAIALVLGLAACDPFGLPATRALENGAAEMLTSAKSFQVQGTYRVAGQSWSIVLQRALPSSAHLQVSDGTDRVEAVVLGDKAYFRGRDFLARHLTDPRSQGLVQAAGNSWWSGIAVALPSLPDLTNGATFRTDFLGPAVDRRTDHQEVGGVDAVELSGARADVFIGSSPPYPLLRVRLKEGVTVDGISSADLVYSDVNKDFNIAAPSPVIDFGNLSTLPPIYTVESVDTSACATPCVVSARVRNLGGLTGASGASTVTFTMTDPVSKKSIGSCTAPIQPDVAFNATATVSCAITGQPVNAAMVTAVATNPARG
jgi:hypothetical protein